MREHEKAALTWGLSVLVLGIVFLFGGQFANKWLESTQSARHLNHRRESGKIRDQILDSGMTNLLSVLKEREPISVIPSAHTSRHDGLGFQPDITPVVEEHLRMMEEALRDRIPDQDHTVEFRVVFKGTSQSSYRSPAPFIWKAVSPRLLAEEDVPPSPLGYHPYSFEHHHTTSPVLFYLPVGENVWDPNLIESRFDPEMVHYPAYAPDSPQVEASYALNIYLRKGPPLPPMQPWKVLFAWIHYVGLVFIILAVPLWVYLDARSRRLNALLWAVFTLPTSFLGGIVYALVTRDAGLICPECGLRVSPKFIVCPYCRTELTGTCPHCGQMVRLNCNYCPSCSAEIE